MDSEVLLGYLHAAGFEIFHNTNKLSDYIIINTCGFIHDAKQESIDTILGYVNVLKDNDRSSLIVMGCLSERYKQQLQKEIPEVSCFYGVNQMKEIAGDIINDRINAKAFRQITTPSHYAYLKIAEGCNRKCSFCAIPLIKGRHISRTIENIIAEAENLSAKGVKEIILISQDLTYYGFDRYRSFKLVDLVSELTKISKLEWIRLQYLYPHNFPPDLLDVINTSEKVCNYLDIPLQHISERILKSMKRGVSQNETIDLLDKIRTNIPGAALRTTLISGYPGETESEHQELIEFVKKYQFDRLGVFAYSHEEDTSAFDLDDNVPEELKKERREEIMHTQESIALEKNRKRIGAKLKVLLDGKEGGFYVGRTQYDSPEVDNEVLIPAKYLDLVTGNFYDLIITAANTYDLFADIHSR